MNTIPIYTVILTGGIASGKSAVADCFLELGIDVVDADKAARRVVEPGEKGWQAIHAHFGDDVFFEDGSLNRKKLRKLVFSDENKRQQLEALLHPLIREQMLLQIRQSESDYVVVDVPLYAENAKHYQADKVLVVDIPESLQISRLIARDNITELDAKQILKVQSRREKRLELADDIVDNTGTMEQLAAQVEILHAKYLSQSLRQRKI
jgi:dephospho-CoA kinase